MYDGAYIRERLHSLRIQHKVTPPAHSRHSRLRTIRLSVRHCTRRRINPDRRRRHCKSHPSAVRSARDLRPRARSSKAQGQFIAVARERLFLARGIWSIQRQPVATGCREALHSEPGRTSSQARFRAGVHHAPTQLRNRFRRAVCPRVMANCIVPTGLGAISAIHHPVP